MSDSYRDLLNRADSHFANVQATQPGNLACRAGCTMCCHGLFEISAADVTVLAEGMSRLEPSVRDHLVANAREVMDRTEHPDLREATPSEREAFFDRAEVVPCPALDEEGRCGVYESRPLVCRTFGLPLREGERYIGEECELNFLEAAPGDLERSAWDLLDEDVLGTDDQFTVPEALLIAARMIEQRK